MKNKLFAIAAATTLFANATPIFATTLIPSSDSIMGIEPVERSTCHCCCCTKKTSIDTSYFPPSPYIDTVTICDIKATIPSIRETTDIILQE